MEKKILSLDGYTLYRDGKSGRFFCNGQATNHGEFIEKVVTERMFDQEWKKDHVPYNSGSDVSANGIGYSIKSSKASLTELLLTDDKSENSKNAIIKKFLATVISTMFLYGVEINGEIVVYQMNKNEFEKFLRDMWTMDKQSGKDKYKLRIRKADSVVVQYFENMLATA